MPKLILRCNYLKNAPPSHLANYMNYISTREGVEKIDNTFGLLPAMVKQKELIADILSKIEDAERLGYDSAAQWQALLRSRMELLCENYKIDSRNLKWYAAFHNESHPPPCTSGGVFHKPIRWLFIAQRYRHYEVYLCP